MNELRNEIKELYDEMYYAMKLMNYTMKWMNYAKITAELLQSAIVIIPYLVMCPWFSHETDVIE